MKFRFSFFHLSYEALHSACEGPGEVTTTTAAAARKRRTRGDRRIEEERTERREQGE